MSTGHNFQSPSSLPEALSHCLIWNDEFYELMGLDKNGMPTRVRLESLGLRDVADELAGKGKL